MGKRQADKQLNESDLDSEEEIQEQVVESQGEPSKEIGERKILKAKRTVQSNQDNSSSQGKLQLSGGLFSSTVTEAAGKKDGNGNEKKEGQPLFNFSTKGTAGGSLFNPPASTTSGQFAFNFNQSTSTTGSSVFSGTSLFGGPTLATGGSLFGGAAATTAPAGGLFSSLPTGGSLFSGQPPTGGSLFSSQAPLFGGQNSLFKATSAPTGQDNEDDEDDEGEAGNEASDGPPAFSADGQTTAALIPGVTDKPVKLNIESKPPQQSPYCKVFMSMVEKFKILPRPVPGATKGEEEKKGGDDQGSKKISMGKGYFSLERAEAGDSKVYLVVFRSMIGKTLFQGTLSAVHSKKRRIEEKAMKLQLKLALLVKDTETKKFRPEHVVVSFSKSEELKEFEQKFEEAITVLKGTTPSEKKSE